MSGICLLKDRLIAELQAKMSRSFGLNHSKYRYVSHWKSVFYPTSGVNGVRNKNPFGKAHKCDFTVLYEASSYRKFLLPPLLGSSGDEN